MCQNTIIENMSDFLLENAGASIKYRVKKEILNCISAHEEELLQKKILSERDIQYILDHRQPDGWLGKWLHSRLNGAKPFDVCEVSLRYLAEKGVNLNHSVFKGVMSSYVTRDKNDAAYEGCCMYEDDYKYPCMGLWLIRGFGIARSGYEEHIDISKEINFALNSFLNVLNYNRLSEAIAVSKSGKHYFKEDLLWPCIYHLKILAFTHSWRTENNIRRLAEAVEHLMGFSQADYKVYTKIKNNYKAPCGAFIQRPVSRFNKDTVKGQWFEKMELFARCGIIPFSKSLQDEVYLLCKTIDNHGACEAYVDEAFFKNWGAYSGLRLEESWRSNISKKCDITFRALLIMKYSGMIK